MTDNHADNSTWSLIPVVLFFLAVATLLFSRSMNRRFSHDEHQFVASGVLVAEEGFLPYRDFPYHHTPYLIYINALIFKFTDWLLLAARSASVAFSVFGAILIYYFILESFSERRRLLRHLAATAAVLVLVTNPFFYRTSGKAWNHDLPTLLILLAVASLARSRHRNGPFFWLAASGFLMGLAGGVRANYLLAVPVFVLGELVCQPEPPGSNQLRRLMVWAGGLGAAVLPLGWHFLTAPLRFLYGNLLYPRFNLIYRQELGHDVGMNLVGKFLLLGETLWADWHSLLLYLMFFLLLIAFIIRRGYHGASYGVLLEVYLLVPALLAGGFLPTPAWRHYFFAPIPVLVLAIFSSLGYWVQQGRSTAWVGLALVPMLIGLQAHGLDDLSHLRSLRRPEGWVTFQIHDLGEQVAALVGDGRVITLAPIVPLEGGATIDPALVNGPFTWRTTNYLSGERQLAFGIIDPQELAAYLDTDPPAGLLTGFEASAAGFRANEPGGLETPFNQYGLEHGYQRVELPTGIIPDPVILWVRPDR